MTPSNTLRSVPPNGRDLPMAVTGGDQARRTHRPSPSSTVSHRLLSLTDPLAIRLPPSSLPSDRLPALPPLRLLSLRTDWPALPPTVFSPFDPLSAIKNPQMSQNSIVMSQKRTCGGGVRSQYWLLNDGVRFDEGTLSKMIRLYR